MGLMGAPPSWLLRLRGGRFAKCGISNGGYAGMQEMVSRNQHVALGISRYCRPWGGGKLGGLGASKPIKEHTPLPFLLPLLVEENGGRGGGAGGS